MKSPAFQFYPNDWLGSPKIMLMSPAEEGAYIRLLAIAWGNADCGLPDDDNELSRLSRLGEGWFAGGSQNIRKCFREANGRLYNDRLLLERKKQELWRSKSFKGGKKSWQVRKNTGVMTQKGWAKGGSQMVQTKAEPTHEPFTNSSSSFSSSNTNNMLIDKSISNEAAPLPKKEPPKFDDFLKEIEQRYPKDVFNPWAYTQRMRLLGRNEEAILHSLRKLMGAEPIPTNPWAYCVSILKIEDGNFNERIAIKKHNKIKEEMQSAGKILKNLGD